MYNQRWPKKNIPDYLIISSYVTHRFWYSNLLLSLGERVPVAAPLVVVVEPVRGETCRPVAAAAAAASITLLRSVAGSLHLVWWQRSVARCGGSHHHLEVRLQEPDQQHDAHQQQTTHRHAPGTTKQQEARQQNFFRLLDFMNITECCCSTVGNWSKSIVTTSEVLQRENQTIQRLESKHSHVIYKSFISSLSIKTVILGFVRPPPHQKKK